MRLQTSNQLQHGLGLEGQIDHALDGQTRGELIHDENWGCRSVSVR